MLRGMFMTLMLTIWCIAVAEPLLLFRPHVRWRHGENPQSRRATPTGAWLCFPLRGSSLMPRPSRCGAGCRPSRTTSTVKALVLEINSPGGTVTASDEIRRAIEQFKAKRGIPVVVSMGGLTASGGYYIRGGGSSGCAADHAHRQHRRAWTCTTSANWRRSGASRRPRSPLRGWDEERRLDVQGGDPAGAGIPAGVD